MKFFSMIIIVTLLFAVVVVLPIATNFMGAASGISYNPHLVKFYIYPKQEGMGVSLWASDNFPMTSGKTDNNSCVIFSVDSSVNYFVTVPQRNISVMLVPVESEYHLVGGIK
jgi:hypothetical protein